MGNTAKMMKTIDRNTFVFYTLGLLLCLILFNAKLNISISAGNNPDGDFISGQMNLLEFATDREFDETNLSQQRKKYRWLYRYVETSIYTAVRDFNVERLNKYIFLLHYVLIMFLSLIFSVKLFQSLVKDNSIKSKLVAAAVFFILYQLVFLLTGFDETFIYIEVLAITIALYASVEKNKLLFLISIILGVSNRETGMVLGVIYPLINARDIKNYEGIIFILMPPIFFSILNIDIIHRFPEVIFAPSFGIDRPLLRQPTTLLDYLSIGELAHSVILYLIYLVPLFYICSFLIRNHKIAWPLYVSILYTLIIFIGSFYGNFTLLLLFVPVYIAAFALGYRKSIVPRLYP